MSNILVLTVDKIEPFQFIDHPFRLSTQLIDVQSNLPKLGENLQLRVFISFEETGSELSTYKEYHPSLIEVVKNEGIKSETGKAEIVVKLRDVSMNYENKRFVISFQVYQSGAGTNVISAQANPVTSIRHKLVIYEEPTARNKLLINDDNQGGLMWYKDEGAKDKCIEMTVQLVDALGGVVRDRNVPLLVSLTYANGTAVYPQNVLSLLSEKLPAISTTSGSETIRFRVNEVSRNHRKQSFQIVVMPDTELMPESGDISRAVSVCFEVKSKRTADARNKPSVPFQTGDRHQGSYLSSGQNEGSEWSVDSGAQRASEEVTDGTHANKRPKLLSAGVVFPSDQLAPPYQSESAAAHHSLELTAVHSSAAAALSGSQLKLSPSSSGLTSQQNAIHSHSSVLPMHSKPPSTFQNSSQFQHQPFYNNISQQQLNSHYHHNHQQHHHQQLHHNHSAFQQQSHGGFHPQLPQPPAALRLLHPHGDIVAPQPALAANPPLTALSEGRAKGAPWGDQAHEKAVEATNAVISWSKAVMQLAEAVLASPVGVAEYTEAFHSAVHVLAGNVKSRYYADTRPSLQCLQDYTGYQFDYHEQHDELLRSLQQQYQSSAPPHGGGSSAQPHPSSSGSLHPPNLYTAATHSGDLRQGSVIQQSHRNSYSGAPTEVGSSAAQGGALTTQSASSSHRQSPEEDGSFALHLLESKVHVVFARSVEVQATEGGQDLVIGIPAFAARRSGEGVDGNILWPLLGFYTAVERPDKSLGIVFRPVSDVPTVSEALAHQLSVDMEAACATNSTAVFPLSQVGNNLSAFREQVLRFSRDLVGNQVMTARHDGVRSENPPPRGSLSEDLVAASIMSTLKQVSSQR